MSNPKPAKKKVVVTTSKKTTPDKAPVKSRKKTTDEPVEMLFKRLNYYYVIGGLVLITLGFILMAGGKMPSPEVWDESLIYSPRRIILAPIVILGGLVMVIFAIFKK